MQIPGPAYRIVTPELALRCFAPADAPELRDAVARSRDHLARWLSLPPAGEPLGAMVTRLRALRAQFDTDRDLHYAILSRDTSEIIGTASLELDSSAAHMRRLGLWLCPDAAERGLGLQAGSAVTRAAFEVMALDRLEIRTDPTNAPVRAGAEKLGFKRDGLVRGLGWHDGARLDLELWTMLVDDYPDSFVKGLDVQAFDALDRRVL